MPKVGKMKFPYTRKGVQEAQNYARQTGKPMNVEGNYQYGGRVPMQGGVRPRPIMPTFKNGGKIPKYQRGGQIPGNIASAQQGQPLQGLAGLQIPDWLKGIIGQSGQSATIDENKTQESRNRMINLLKKANELQENAEGVTKSYLSDLYNVPQSSDIVKDLQTRGVNPLSNILQDLPLTKRNPIFTKLEPQGVPMDDILKENYKPLKNTLDMLRSRIDQLITPILRNVKEASRKSVPKKPKKFQLRNK